MHADLHCRRVHDELRATEEERLFQFQESNEKRPNGPKRARRGVKLTLS